MRRFKGYWIRFLLSLSGGLLCVGGAKFDPAVTGVHAKILASQGFCFLIVAASYVFEAFSTDAEEE